MSQTISQNKPSDKEPNKMEMGNLPGAEFKTLVIKLVNELRRREVEPRENFNNDMENTQRGIENIEENQSESKNKTSEMKSPFE